MPDIALDVRTIEFVTDLQVTVWARRAFVEARFVAQNEPLTAFGTSIDPGAPFGVIPYSLWHSR